MSKNLRSILRVSFAALLACIAGLQPLRAQLDPRLQTSKTDFMDLFQQSTSFKVKPEIMTILDWSGSMQAIMYHPGYNNTSNTDGAGSQMSFWLTGAAGSYVPNAYLDVDGTVNVLQSSTFIRPDGTILTEAMVNNTDIASGLYGAAWKAGDIRNWIRAASHVRFTETFGSPAVTRTIDIPICWKIMDRNSNGYPLTSQTALDQTTVTNPDGSTSTYGSGTQIEMDLTYKIQNSSGDRVLSGGAAQILPGNGSPSGGSSTYRCTNQQIDYTRVYINWLFTGTYAAGTPYAGKYVIFDAANASLAGGQGSVDWGRGYGTFGAGASITPVSATVSVPANSWVTSSVNRVQANKIAVIKTWIKYQKSVFWAYRFLDESGNGSNSGNATSIHNNSRSWATASDPTTTTVIGRETAWRTMNSNSVGEMKRIASLFPGTWTPLTYAMARGLAQYADPNNVFLDVETGADAPVQCQYKFLILFTDGQDNNGGSGAPLAGSAYLSGASGSSGSAEAGNAAVIAAKTNIDRFGPWWNLYTFAAMGAHLADSSLTNFMEPTVIASGTSGVPSTFLPFAVPARGAVTYKAPHRLVTTMTVGVSLGGAYNNTASPKYRLFAAASIGDPARTSWDLTTLTPFTLLDANDPTKGKTPSSVYFFDATDPDLLTKSLDYAVLEAGKKSNINVTNSPTLPYIGATFGKQLYIGKFQPPKTGGTIWDGDLLAFSTRETATGIDILDNSGNPTTTLDSTTGIWSAKTELKARMWTGRKLFTRIPGTAATPEPGLTYFSDLDPAYSIIKPFTATALASDALKKPVIQFIAGGNTSGTLDGSGRPTTNRDTIMGDIINSSPAALEYTWPVWFTLPTTIQGYGNRFRLILAGTNQGWLHAFGEVSQVTPVTDALGNVQEVVQGKIAELWSFLPTDFLKRLEYVTQTTNPHRFMVDGTPSIYHLDLPPSAGGSANGTVDGSSIATSERAIVIIGLRKGGRSFYALDVRDPTNPALKWSLVPDEAASFGFPASRTLTGGPDAGTITNILKSFGFSTAHPSVGRVMFNGVMKDAVFFSGGLSLPEIETNFLDASGNPMKLGRSVLALDVETGKVLAAVDMTTISAGIQSLPAGLVPFEFFLNSGLAQRAYFMDYGGGLWCWGSRETLSTAPYVDYRLDNSDIARWTTTGLSGGAPGIRKVAQDSSGNNARYTTLPAPFRVGSFPGVGKPLQAPPAAVGVAMVSGDRNNPLDYLYTAATRPSGHRVTVVFDRQDSKAWSLDSTGIMDGNLKDFSSQNNPASPLIDGSNSNYYLAPATGNPFFGYYVTFLPGANSPFVNKGITEPMVVAGSLFYTYFNPSEADPCSGGEGISHSMRICDVVNPIVNDPRTGLGCTSGEVFYYAGVATGYVAYGTRGVIQAGVSSSGAGGPGGSLTTPVAKRFTGKQTERFPKPRVWRTVR